MSKKIGIVFLIIVIIGIIYVVCQSGVKSSGINSIEDDFNYKGVYYNDNKSLGIRIDELHFKYVYYDGSGQWGDYSITSKTDSKIEISFGNVYNVNQGTQTYEVSSKIYTGATIMKSNDQIVLYLHYKNGYGNTQLVKE